MKDNLILLTGKSNTRLAESISNFIGVDLGAMEVFKFANDNTFCKINVNIRRRDVYVIQSTSRPVNDNIMELLIIIDACKRASANNITAVLPYYGYARTDKKDQPRVPITAKLVADLITVAGCQRIICMDLHAEAIQGFFNIPVDHLYATPIFIDYLKELKKNRDNKKVEQSLQAISDMASLPDTPENNIMPAITDAVKCYATVGEIADTLRKVWGEYRQVSVF